MAEIARSHVAAIAAQYPVNRVEVPTARTVKAVLSPRRLRDARGAHLIAITPPSATAPRASGVFVRTASANGGRRHGLPDSVETQR